MTEMLSWTQRRYGPASALVLASSPIPRPGHGEVVVRVRATALNAGDVRIMLGDPLIVRPFFGLTRPTQAVRGLDIVGTVVAVDDKAVGVEVGEDVVGELVAGGGLAEYVRVDASRVVPLPSDVPADLACTVPTAGGTAWQALDLARVGLTSVAVPRVLIIGASGGVGTFAVQLAALRGAEVWASCAERTHPLISSLGAVRVFDHRQEPLADLPAHHFDAVIDIAGGMPLRHLQRLTAHGGAVVLVTGDGGPVLGPLPRMLRAAVLSIGSSRRVHMLSATGRPEIVTKMLELVGEGRLHPVIDREYPFTEGEVAMERIAAGHVVGKVVVRGTD